MSFMLTTEQVKNQTKRVTRRNGWEFLQVGQSVQPIRKGQGLRKGEKVEKIGPPIQVVGKRRERLDEITEADCVLEGFPDMSPTQFVKMYCKGNHCTPDTIVTRIEFIYVTSPSDEAQTH